MCQKLKILSIVDTRCTTNLTQIKSRLVVNSHNLPIVIQVSSTSSIIDNDREILLTARSTCCGEIFFTESGVWDKVPEGCTLIFEDTQISLYYGTGRMPKISSIRPVVSIQYWRVMDRRTHDDSKYLLA